MTVPIRKPRQPLADRPYLTADEAAAYCRLSRKTLLNHKCTGKLRAAAHRARPRSRRDAPGSGRGGRRWDDKPITPWSCPTASGSSGPPGATAKGEARTAPERVVADAYRPAGHAAEPTWDDALTELAATPDLRPDRVRDHRTAVDAVRKLYPRLAGPAAVTPAVAAEFSERCLATPYAQLAGPEAREYERTPTTVNSYLRSLWSLWGTRHWGRPGGFVPANPLWDVPYVNAPRGKRVRVPADGAVAAFFAWLADRHPRWELPRVFVTAKMLTGCRTMNLCQARTADLRRLAGPVWL